MKKIITYILIIVAATTQVNAQNANGSATQQVALNMSNAIELSFVNSATTTSVVSMSFSTILSLITGVTSNDQDLVVRSNKKFKVTAAPAATNFTYIGTSLLNNLLSVTGGALKVKVSSNQTGGSATTNWTNLNSTSSPVTILNNCNPGSNQTFSIQYKTTPGATIAPGIYNMDVVYTATQI